MTNLHPDFLLNKISKPADLKGLTLSQLQQLADEGRQLVVEKDAAIGGHVGPNLGAAEATLAFHYVFDSPQDKIVWDISHESYIHKMLTGRKEGFLDPDHYFDVTGYTSPDESEHDFFTVGHTSTSVALATGMARARDVKGEKGNIVAFIGDGSLSGGLAFEGLNNAATLNSNIIIVVNDNQMSIAENHGGLYRVLDELRASNGTSANNPFKAMGFDYRYVADGNNLADMIAAFKAVKDLNHPVVLHINTLKGKGYQPAIDNKMAFHWHAPFDIETGEPKAKRQPTYWDAVLAELDQQIAAGQPIVALNSAIPGAFGLKAFQAKHPDRYVDTGIAEQDAITEAAGLAKNGARPVVFQNSTFLQRAYDQLAHDVTLNDLPVVMLITSSGISAASKTHLAIFDIPYLTSLPNLEYLQASNQEELISMLQWALRQTDHPVAIRVPSGPVVHGFAAHDTYAPLQYNTIQKGSKVALLGLGKFLALAEETAAKLGEHGIEATVINPMSASTLDVKALDALKADHSLVATFEDGSLAGGFGEHVAAYLGDSNLKVLNFGAKKAYSDNTPVADLYQEFHLTAELATQDILAQLTK
ncbi:1-deoxy-D-xylulose-5-phosphate synthase [Ligilactobacillus equi]|uniref:1-deoxy-D-xylulose-5-phosphate synthase n=1 Tax=Ligilactobacillus equi DSM 15833 = JCM 10991 TaxID=1423740 RepID=A0A0R1TP31_9LACO|nr:1-deoxy-D-xylulose-5-phosphate synthase [Ligilactobacillus equi]KRL83181.1 1-deoxy-D-xylulose-5-phosphate synthase [Ligilactobacillus equi DSM 15833 = JCM 10991]